MNDWAAGYVADIGYTFGYYPELNPLRAKLALLSEGIVPNETSSACELGFGQGLSVNLHSAGSLTKWFGTDFNPSQAGFAQDLSRAWTSGPQLYDEAFVDFVHRDDLPDFDYIGLHGIWSWTSDSNRQLIVDLLRRKLKVGGVLYVSYNTLPGWASFAPMRHLMTEHAEVLGAEGRGIINRINGAIDFASQLLGSNPLFGRANPFVGQRVDKIKEQNRHYLAHEYFNRDWHPMYFSTMAEWLEPAKLQYACSANYLDHIDSINLSAEQQKFLGEIPDPMFRETTRDFMVNQQFRRDYWVKGIRKLNPLEQSEAIRSLKFVLGSFRDDISLKVTGALGEGDMSEAIYAPILDALSDYAPQSFGQIESTVRKSGISFGQILQALMVLVGQGHIVLVQDESITHQVKSQTEKLNAYICQKARGSDEVNCLASPVSGGGIYVGRFEQLFVQSIQDGKKLPEDWAKDAWQIISSQGSKLVSKGETLELPEENLAELSAQARSFAEKKLPILQSLQIVP